MGAAEEDLTESSALEECCCGPMFLRESRGLSNTKRAESVDALDIETLNLKQVEEKTKQLVKTTWTPKN